MRPFFFVFDNRGSRTKRIGIEFGNACNGTRFISLDLIWISFTACIKRIPKIEIIDEI